MGPPPTSHLHQPPGHVRNRPYISGCACHGNARRPVLLLPSDLHKTMPSKPDDERHAPLRPCQRWSTAPGSASSESAYARDRTRRSEEHTSELQSLMSNSYAVFCLKKKHIPNTHDH